ncbi:MAG: DNA alkylation repair protein [Bacteroidales bacterium]
MIQDLYTRSLSFIRHHRDGETADMMRERGLNYNMIYGVSSAILYRYATKIGKNQELAKMLWQENFREAQLLALMVSDSEIISEEEIEYIVSSFNNHELVEIASLYFLPNIPNVKGKAYKWIEDNKIFVKMTGYMLLHNIFRHKQDITIYEFEKFIPSYERDFLHHNFFVRNAVVNAFQEIAFRKPELKKYITDATKRIIKRTIGTEFELQSQDMLHVLNYC